MVKISDVVSQKMSVQDRMIFQHPGNRKKDHIVVCDGRELQNRLRIFEPSAIRDDTAGIKRCLMGQLSGGAERFLHGRRNAPANIGQRFVMVPGRSGSWSCQQRGRCLYCSTRYTEHITLENAPMWSGWHSCGRVHVDPLCGGTRTGRDPTRQYTATLLSAF